MNIVAVLSWYDEPASWLAETVASTAKLCSHVVAVDGAYALFPGATARPTSDPIQADTITRTARAVGVGCTVHTPAGVWWGNEVEKRDHALRLASTVAGDGDWLFVIDADETVHTAPADTVALLAASGLDVAAVTMADGGIGRSPIRRMYRAGGLRIGPTHYTVTTGDGRTLNGDSGLEPALPLWDVIVDHRSGQRPTVRQEQKRRYATARDKLGIEAVADAC